MEIREAILYTIGNSCKSKRYRNIKRQRDRVSYTLGVKRKKWRVKNYIINNYLYTLVNKFKQRYIKLYFDQILLVN